ncbi:hypothetical protein DVT68_13400 [Dyella solisilvae]|uniref:Lipoprotein n=1 Tax=Dyella solisilvae TaxID=1920168 RepID=A0A370K5Z3_9GAMM|nr:hypothetical protein [Dyella solisilvae]RDI98073.1 hypothetical protein DVT68_13400 [Dyella solisilvae]
MKQLIAIATFAVLLTACGGLHGLRDTTPKMSSRTNKDVATYLQCVRAKWSETAQVGGSEGKQESTLTATNKAGANMLLIVTQDGTGAQVIMHETQDPKKEYNSAYRDAAVACL